MDIQFGAGKVLTTSGNPVQAAARLKSVLNDAAALARLRPDDFEAVRREGPILEALFEAFVSWTTPRL